MRKLWILTALFSISVLAVLGIVSADVESPSDLSSVGSQVRETSLGDLTVDAVRSASGAQVALFPAGALKEITIPKGRVKTEDVLKCLQYPDDRIVVIELTGNQLTKALERSVYIFPQKNMGFLQVSGITFTFDPDSPRGSRVTSAAIGGQEIVSDRKYRVSTTESLAIGAYGYFTIWGKDLSGETKDKTAAQAMSAFLSQRDSIDYQAANRILQKGK